MPAVQADRHPDRDVIVVEFEYDAADVQRIKEIYGARFVPKQRGGPFWTLPLTLRACYALREQFGDRLTVGEPLAAWAREELQEQDRMGMVAEAENAELALDTNRWWSEDLVNALNERPFQRAGVRFLADSPCPLLADQQGLGKTLQAIAGVFEAELDRAGPLLVVCPKSAMENAWARELRRWQPHPIFVAQGRTAQQRQRVIDDFKNHDGVAWLIVNPGMIQFRNEWRYCEDHGKGNYVKELRACAEEDGCEEIWVSPFPYLHEERWGGVICDEVHRNDFAITNPKTKTARSIDALLLASGGKRISMSGTPMRGRAQDLFGVIQWLTRGTKYEKDYRSRWQWMERYVESEPNQWAKSGKTFTGRLRKDRENELFQGLKPFMLRRTKAEVAQDLPAKQHIDVWCDLTKEQQKLYEELVNDGAVHGVPTDGVLSELTRARQIATAPLWIDDNETFRYDVTTSGKFSELLEKLEESGVLEDQPVSPARPKVVVATQWAVLAHSVALGLSGVAPGQVALMTGQTSQQERTRLVQEFQTDAGPAVLVMTTETGGVSITLDRADTLHILDETWEPTALEQLEDRLHRLSRTERTTQPVTIYMYRSTGTIDEAVYMNNLDKSETQKLIMDDRRQILYPR